MTFNKHKEKGQVHKWSYIQNMTLSIQKIQLLSKQTPIKQKKLNKKIYYKSRSSYLFM